MSGLVDSPKEGNAADVTTPQADIPEQYRGKSPSELVEMYQSLEKKLGQQSEELGSLRKLADSALMNPQASSETAEHDEVDFYSDPEKAIERIVQRHLEPFNSIAQKQTMESTQQKLDAAYPDWKDTVKNESFQEWVGKSKVRVALFQSADRADYDSAAELFSTWADIQTAKTGTKAAEKTAVARDRQLRAATTEKGTNQIDPRKILNRADLRSLKQNDPNRYNDLLPDIRKAYAEGRVR